MNYTPFSYRFATNYAPKDEEFKKISQLIVEPLEQLRSLDTEISKLQRSIDELSAKRKQLNDFIVPHQALLSPIRRIPQEVLREIFVQCLPTGHDSVMSCQDTPLLLGRVCSSWRSISRDTPMLWSSIFISIPEPTTREREGVDMGVLIQAVTDWLERSGTLPLSITLFHMHVLPAERDLVQYLMLLCDRCKHIDLSLSTTTYSLVASLTKEDVPLLESCSFRISDMDDVASKHISLVNSNPFNIFHAPRLRRLLTPSSMTPRDGNWSALTEVIIVEGSPPLPFGLRVDLALDLLRHCVNLVICTMTLSEGHTSVSGHPTLTLPGLKSLVIYGGREIGPFLGRLQLPVLRSLELTVYSFMTVTYHGSLYAFLGRTTTLESFTLSSSSLTRETLTDFIIHLPSITHLYLRTKGSWSNKEIIPFDNSVLAVLVATRERSLLPRLKVIESCPTSVSRDALLGFIKSRTTLASTYGVARLDRAGFELPYGEGEDILPAFSEIISGGTEIIITEGEKPLTPRRVVNPRRGVDYLIPRLNTAIGA